MGTFGAHTQRYKKHHLVYFEQFQWVDDAISREKQLKGWVARRKEALIETCNPEWRDLSDGWFKDR